MDEEKIEKIRKTITTIMTVLAKKKPLAYATIAPWRIEIADTLPFSAASDGERILLRRDVAEKLVEQRRFDELTIILLHMALHNVFAHPERMRNFSDPAAFNIAADGKIDLFLRDLLGKGHDKITFVKAITAEDVARIADVSVEFVKKRTVEEIAKRIMRQGQQLGQHSIATAKTGNQQPQQRWQEGQGKGEKKERKKQRQKGGRECKRKKQGQEGQEGQEKRQGGKDTSSNSSSSTTSNTGTGNTGRIAGDILTKNEAKNIRGETVWEGDKKLQQRLRKLVNEGKIDEALREIARSVKARASVAKTLNETMKSVGSEKGFYERVIDAIAAGKADWRKLLIKKIQGLGRSVRRTWAKLNKKNLMMPGRIVEGIDEAVVAIDVSGSISDKELGMFKDAVIDAVKTMRPQKITVIQWDYGIQKVERMRAMPEKIRKLKTTGGGGTAIAEALQYALKIARRKRVAVIIASDWYLADSPETVEKLMREVKRRAATAAIATPNHDKRYFSIAEKYADVSIVLPEMEEPPI